MEGVPKQAVKSSEAGSEPSDVDQDGIEKNVKESDMPRD